MLIPLPNAEQRIIRAHPYPFQVGYQTEQFLHAHFFHASLQAIGTSVFLAQPNAVHDIEREMLSMGGEPESIAQGWECLNACQAVLSGAVYQNAIVALNSQWDWYARKLGQFVQFARPHISGPPLSAKQERDLQRIGFLGISQQLETLEAAAAVAFNLASQDIENLTELSLVRNLVLHNRSEVDAHYLGRSACTRFPINHLREVTAAEGEAWHKSLLDAVLKTCVALAERCVTAPHFSHL